MLKVCLIFVTLLLSSRSNAFLDSIAESAKDLAEAAAVSGAVTEMIDEIDPDSAPVEENRRVQEDYQRIQQEINQAKYLDNESKEIMRGPNLTSKRLSANIKFTTQFIRRTKRLLTTVGLISPEVTTAVNTAQTNTQMNEVLQNQQTMILLQQQQINEQKQKELAERKSWEDFISSQRAIRNGQGQK